MYVAFMEQIMPLENILLSNSSTIFSGYDNLFLNKLQNKPSSVEVRLNSSFASQSCLINQILPNLLTSVYVLTVDKIALVQIIHLHLCVDIVAC